MKLLQQTPAGSTPQDVIINLLRHCTAAVLSQDAGASKEKDAACSLFCYAFAHLSSLGAGPESKAAVQQFVVCAPC